MQTLSVLAVEDGAIIVASPAGERFRLPVDAALRARLQGPLMGADEKRLSPREIQAHVRAGLSAQQVAAMTGVPVANIERFVGPVLAERAYLVETALAVRLPPETEGARSRTFGAVMGERLDALAARDVRWTSAKEPSGWVLAVSFIADDVQHNARWRFDPKHMRLDPDNVEASTLSQIGVPAALTPRLRAIEPTAPVTIVPQAATAVLEDRPAAPYGARVAPPARTEPDSSRFDSAAFRFPPLRDTTTERSESADPAEAHPAVGEHVAATWTPDAVTQRRPTSDGPTTDQLAQLARRRGQREPAPDTGELPITRAMDVIEPGDVFAPRPAERSQQAPERPEPAEVRHLPVRPIAETPAQDRPTEPLRRRRDRGGRGAFGQLEPTGPRGVDTVDAPDPITGRPRRGRTSMPSWDEIVFGRDEP